MAFDKPGGLREHFGNLLFSFIHVRMYRIIKMKVQNATTELW